VPRRKEDWELRTALIPSSMRTAWTIIAVSIFCKRTPLQEWVAIRIQMRIPRRINLRRTNTLAFGESRR
jgi:hypothetical protein